MAKSFAVVSPTTSKYTAHPKYKRPYTVQVYTEYRFTDCDGTYLVSKVLHTKNHQFVKPCASRIIETYEECKAFYNVLRREGYTVL